MARRSTVKLAKPLERVIAGGHPWIFRDAVVGALPAAGEVVTVLDRKGRFLARGLAEAGPIGVRVFTTDDRAVDRELLRERLEAAIELRRRLAPPDTNALRLVHGEGDALPGLVVDRYAEHAVLRYDGAAIERWREQLEVLVRERLGELGVTTILRRRGRGQSKQIEIVTGARPDAAIEIREHGMTLLADLVHGQKTGAFLDHRPNRLRVRELVAAMVQGGLAPRVANLFGYTGGFSLAAGLGGAAKVVTVDVAAPALALAEQAWQRNALAPERHYGAAVEVERWLAEQRRRFELVIADPPSFAPSRATRARGLGAYRALHGAALAIVADGGLYLAASCSSQVDRAAFEDTLRAGARAASVELTLLERSGAGFDHPVPLGFPEGEYLVAALCRVTRRRT